MKKYFCFFGIFFLLLACGDPGKGPQTLESVVDDKKLAEMLPGKWTYTFLGKGYIYYTETLSFSKENAVMSFASAYNEYETISNPKVKTATYKIKIESEIMTRSSETGAVVSYFRIEKTDRNKITLFERTSKGNARSELPGKEYTKGN